jgi:carbamoyl-phosphate synthase large subunit
MSEQSFNILLTPGGGPGILAQLFSLKRSERYRCRAIMADANAASGNLFLPEVDAAYRLPTCDHRDYLDQLLALIEKENIQVMYSGLDEEMPVLAGYRAQIEAAGCGLLLPGRDALLAAFDKGETYRRLLGKVRMPPTWPLDDSFDAESIWRELDGQLVIKAEASRGGRYIFIPEDREEYNFYLRRARRYKAERGLCFQVQQFIVGQEYNVSSLHDHAGAPIYAVSRRKFEARQIKSTTTAGVVERHDEVIDMALTAVSEMNLTPGFNNTEIVCSNEGGLPYLIEINGGRTAAQDMNLVASGINLTDLLIDLTQGCAVEPIPHPKDGVAILKIRKDVIVDFAQIDAHCPFPKPESLSS